MLQVQRLRPVALLHLMGGLDETAHLSPSPPASAHTRLARRRDLDLLERASLLRHATTPAQPKVHVTMQVP